MSDQTVAPAQAVAPAAPTPPASSTVKVAVAYPVSVFEHGIEDLVAIGRDFVDVPKDKLPALLEAAEKSAVKLIQGA